MHGVGQTVGDAVAHGGGALAVAAGRQAVAHAAHQGRGAGLDAPLQGSAHAARGQTHGGFHEADVLGLGAEDDLLEDRRGVALEGADEARAHLHAGGARRQEPLDVRMIPDAARHEDGEVAPLVPLCDHLGQDVLQGVGRIQAAFVAEALVATAFGAFQHDGIRQAVVLSLPLLADHLEGATGRHDGHQRHVRIAHVAWEGQGQAGARHDHLGAAGEGGLHGGLVALDGAEDVHAHGAAAFGAFPRGADDPFQGLGRVQRVSAVRTAQAHLGIRRAVVARADGRDQAHAAFLRHGARQAFPGDAHAHATLLDGIGQVQVADAQARHGAGTAAHEGLGHGVQTRHQPRAEGRQG